jgi:hypothetical protein
MQIDDSQRQERRETVEELSELLLIGQEMGRRLANETHGTPYELVLELNELLHQARAKIALIQASSPIS